MPSGLREILACYHAAMSFTRVSLRGLAHLACTCSVVSASDRPYRDPVSTNTMLSVSTQAAG